MATQVVMPKLSPTMEEGQLTRWLKKEGDKVSMGEPLAEIDTDKATMELPPLSTYVFTKLSINEAQTHPARGTAQAREPSAEVPPSHDGGRQLISPIAARMAADAGINLKALQGSGPGGRIVKRDVEAAMTSTPSSRTQTQLRLAPLPKAGAKGAVYGPSAYRDEPISEMRRTIARRLFTSLVPVPHFFLTPGIDM